MEDEKEEWKKSCCVLETGTVAALTKCLALGQVDGGLETAGVAPESCFARD